MSVVFAIVTETSIKTKRSDREDKVRLPWYTADRENINGNKSIRTSGKTKKNKKNKTEKHTKHKKNKQTQKNKNKKHKTTQKNTTDKFS